MNIFYIYKHIRLDSNKPFYVGKGHDKRAFRLSGRNNLHIRIAKKHGCKVVILMSNLSEIDAFEYEKEWIATYKAYGYCEANMTNGGDGSAGCKWSEEAKLKFKHPKTFLHRQKLSLAKLGKKRIIPREPPSIETRNKISRSLTGFKHSLEFRKQNSINKKGKCKHKIGKHWKLDLVTKKRIWYS